MNDEDLGDFSAPSELFLPLQKKSPELSALNKVPKWIQINKYDYM
jgi:hypothetical protein